MYSSIILAFNGTDWGQSQSHNQCSWSHDPHLIPRTLVYDAKFVTHSTANFDLQSQVHIYSYGTAVTTCGNEVLQSESVRQKLRMKTCHLSVSLLAVASHSVHISSALSTTVDFTFYIPIIMIRSLQFKPTKCSHFAIITIMF